MSRFQPEKMALKEAALRNLACQECGGNIVPDAMFCDHCHAPIVRRYCAGCSNLVPETSAFCPFCGTSAKKVVREKSGLVIKIIPAAACLLLLMIFIGREDHAIQHAASRPGNEMTAGSGGTGYSAPVQAVVAVPFTKPPGAGIGAEEGRRLNVQAHDLMTQKRFAEAIPLLAQSLRAFGDDSTDEGYPYALFNMAQSLRITGQPDKALPILEKLVKSHPENGLFQRELVTAQAAVTPKTTSAEVFQNQN